MTAEDELAQLLAGQGIDLSQLGGGGGPSGLSQFGLGGQFATAEVFDGATFKPRGVDIPFVAQNDVNQPIRSDDTSTIDDHIAGLFTMSRDKLENLQRRLWEGGYYGDVDPSEVRWGNPADAAAAYSGALTEAAIFYAGGINKTVDEVIADARKDRQQGADTEEEVSELLTGGGADTIQLSDPATIRTVADAISQKILGRRLTARQKAEIVSEIQGAEGSSQQGAIDAARATEPDVSTDELGQTTVNGEVYIPDESGQDTPLDVPRATITATDVDPRARIEELLRTRFPREAAGTDASDGYRAVLSMLGAGGLGGAGGAG